MTNRSHPPKPPTPLLEEVARAATAVAKGSSDPLATVVAMAPIPTEAHEMVVAIEAEEEIYALVMAGWTPTQIAHHRTKQTGTRWTSADVDAALEVVGRRNLARTSAQMAFAAQLELDRMEAALKAVWGPVTDGNLLAIDRFLKLSKEKRDMLGLDAPDVRVQLQIGGQDAMDLSHFTAEELRQFKALQQKATSAAKEKVVRSRDRD